MKINYISRNRNAGYSLRRVFNNIKPELHKKYDVSEIELPCFGASIYSILRNLIYVIKRRSDINHITGDCHYVALSLIGKKNILTIHDIVLLKRTAGLKRCILKFFWYTIPVKIVDRVVCISNKTKNDLLEELNVPAEKVSVIYNAIDKCFTRVEKAFPIKPIILHVGTGWNKNLDRVIESLSGLYIHLRIIGKLSERQLFLLKQYEIDFSNTYDLSDDQIRSEYANSDIVSFPSIYEGFGLPIIEAQTIGRPVIISNIEPLIEIAGSDYMFVDPSDVISIKNGFIRMIEDTEFRNYLVQKGYVNSERFKPENLIKQYDHLYNNL